MMNVVVAGPPRPPGRSQRVPDQLPLFPVSRTHLEALTDGIGIAQHANGARPDLSHGYCVDDVARVFGLPPKLGHGGAFTALWRADREAAIAYNRRDVEIEIEIARICGCI